MGYSEKKTGRYFNLLLYPDDDRFSSQIEALNEYYRWVGILHDADIYDSDLYDSDGFKVHSIGESKKPHMHVVCRIPSSNATTLKSVVDRVCLVYGNSIRAQVCNNYRASLRYLCHADDLNKTQYDVSSLVGSSEMVAEATKAIKNSDLNTQTLELLDYLDSTPCALTPNEFCRLACSYGLISAWKSLGYDRSSILQEHNSKFKKVISNESEG